MRGCETGNALRRTALHEAAAKGDLTGVRSLVATGLPLDVRDAWACIPLHDALYGEHGAVIDFLLQAGARTDLRDKWGFKAADLLHGAAGAGQR